MTVFAIVSGTCGVLAFLVLCAQGVGKLRTETRNIFLVQSPRSPRWAADACEKYKLNFEPLDGTEVGYRVTGRIYRLDGLSREGQGVGWLRTH